MAGRHDKTMPGEADESDSDKSDVELASAEENEDSSSEDDDDSDSSDSDADNSNEDENEDSSDGENVWEEPNEKQQQTREALEKTLKDTYISALNEYARGNHERAEKLLRGLLKKEYISEHHTSYVDWDKKVNDRLSDMARLFVGAHKNLAELDRKDAIGHYLQILSIAPKNDKVWFDLGSRCVEEGDLELALFAFEKSGDWRADEAVVSVLFLSRSYRACLERIMAIEQQKGQFLKGEYLKQKIRSISRYYEEACREICGPIEPSFRFPYGYEEKTSKQLEKLCDRIRGNMCVKEPKVSVPDVIELDIGSEQDMTSILTIFCDLFDRIEAYSSLGCQPIRIVSWMDPSVHDVLDQCIEVVSLMDDLLSQVPDMDEDSESLIVRKSVRCERKKDLISPASSSAPRTQLSSSVTRSGKKSLEYGRESKDCQMGCSEPPLFLCQPVENPSNKYCPAAEIVEVACYGGMRSAESAGQFPRASFWLLLCSSDEGVIIGGQSRIVFEAMLPALEAIVPILSGTVADVILIYCSSDVLMNGESGGATEELVEDYGAEIENELAFSLGVQWHVVAPLKEFIRHSPPSPPPTTHFDEKEALCRLREILLDKGDFTIFEAIDSSLLLVSSLPIPPPSSSSLSEVLVQCYRRLCRMSIRLTSTRYLPLHILMYEYGSSTAHGYLLDRFSRTGMEGEDIRWPNMDDVIRFLWRHALQVEEEMKKEEILAWVGEMVDGREVASANGVIHVQRVDEETAKIGRAKRIRSLQHLWQAGMHKEIIEIAESDISWSSMEDEHLLECASFVAHSYAKAARVGECVLFVTRVLSWILSNESVPSSLISEYVSLLDGLDLSVLPMGHAPLSSLLYTLLRLTEHDHLSKDWRLWKVAYKAFRQIEGPVTMEIVRESCEGNGDNENLLRSLRLLSIAHERLARLERCADDQGAFLSFALLELHRINETPVIQEIRTQKLFSYNCSNFLEDAAQLLQCLFGKYSKKRRLMEDHGCGLECTERADLRSAAISLSLPFPLPLYDDREKVGQETIDLITNRFPSILECDHKRKRCTDMFREWMRRAKKGETSWSHEGCDSMIELNVFYVMALHFYRLAKEDECVLFCELFLSSRRCLSNGPKIVSSVWMMYGHMLVERLVQHYDEDVLYEYPWHLRPFRMAMHLNPPEAMAYFNLGQILYQIGTRLSRFFHVLPLDDIRHRGSDSLLRGIRRETTVLFNAALIRIPDQLNETTASEIHWLCYFYLAKLQAKEENVDVEKVLEGFYESACAVENHGYTYQAKISVKNQRNLEPVEIHYQVHSFIWKHISRTANPSLRVLRVLLSYARAFLQHGVNKGVSGGRTLCVARPTSPSLTGDVPSPANDDEDVRPLLDELTSKVEVTQELIQLCTQAFEVCCDRFPHPKAHFRLVEIALHNGDIETAQQHLKRIFRKKKKEDDMFESMVEISCTDILRSGSQAFHATRSTAIAVRVCLMAGDALGLLDILSSLVQLLQNQDDSERFVLRINLPYLVSRTFKCLCMVVRRDKSTLSRQFKMDLWTLYSSTELDGARVIVHLRRKIQLFVSEYLVSMDRLREEATTFIEAAKKKVGRKRKALDIPSVIPGTSSSSTEGPLPSTIFPSSVPQSLPSSLPSSSASSSLPSSLPSSLLSNPSLLAAAFAQSAAVPFLASSLASSPNKIPRLDDPMLQALMAMLPFNVQRPSV